MLAERHPELDPVGFNVLDFVHAIGSGLDALMYSRLFWPEFVVVDGMVFRKETIEDMADREMLVTATHRYEGRKELIEQDLNFVEVAHLFGARAGESGEAQYWDLAELLAQMWECRLRTAFPTRRFAVEVVPGDEPSLVGVVFYQLCWTGEPW